MRALFMGNLPKAGLVERVRTYFRSREFRQYLLDIKEVLIEDIYENGMIEEMVQGKKVYLVIKDGARKFLGDVEAGMVRLVPKGVDLSDRLAIPMGYTFMGPLPANY